MRKTLAVATVLLSLSACTETGNHSTPTGPPVFDIADAAHGGNSHFYFLPPMAPDPSPTGTFDGSVGPAVEICVWSTLTGTCSAPLEIYNTSTGPGSETIRVDAAAEQYVVNWHTANIIDNVALGADEVLRIRVVVGPQELGHADVQVVGSARELKNLDTGEVVALREGRTLPVKFRIEEGALDGGGAAMSAGGLHSCGVTTAGTYCWGWNRWGQLGAGYATPLPSNEPTPLPVTGGHVFRSVSTGELHTCGLTADGEAYCWGRNVLGELGLGYRNVYADHVSPDLVVGSLVFQSVITGYAHSCGVTTAGDTYCWGGNGAGQLGRGTVTPYPFAEPSPAAVLGDAPFQSVTAGRAHTCGLTATGKAYCWGYNGTGQLGTGALTYIESVPVPVAGDHTFQSLSAGMEHTCGVSTSGAVLCWGRNTHGQLGAGFRSAAESSPLPLTGNPVFSEVSAGGYHTCGVTPGGDVFCWGWSYWGQLGIGGLRWPPYETAPVAVAGGHVFRSVSAGDMHTCGVTTEDRGYCWGHNRAGAVGVAITDPNIVYSPVAVTGNHEF